jgi:hypothetical protein
MLEIFGSCTASAGFFRDYNGIAPVEPVQVEGDGCSAGDLRRLLLEGAVVGACPGQQATR